MSAGPEYVYDPIPGIGPEIDEKVLADAQHLWAQLPVGLAEAVEPHSRTMAEYVLREIQRSVPEYAATGSEVEQAIVKGVERAIDRCLADVRLGASGVRAGRRDDWRSLFVRLGSNEYAEGRGIDCLQAAYRVAGRAAWHYVARVGRALDLPADLLCLAAEAVFATVDDISALSVDGYTEARMSAAGAVERRRSRLLNLLLSDPPPPAAAVEALAGAVGWAVPEHVRVVALAPLEPGARGAVVLDGEVLRELEGPRPCLLTGAPDVHLARLGMRLGGRRAAIGPLVPVAEAAASHRCARRALDLAGRGVLPDEPVLRCDDHLMAMWLVADPYLARRLAGQVLAPLRHPSGHRPARFAETLLSWLQHQGNVARVAELLQVHPQTVRYRIGRLDELFGGRLADPEWRLAAEMALRASALLGLWREPAED